MMDRCNSMAAESSSCKCRRKYPSLNSRKGYYLFLLPTSAALLILLHIHTAALSNCTALDSSKLRESITFLPLKDLRYAAKPLDGHTWFMSSTLDTHKNGEPQFQEFPSNASGGRILCLRGRDAHDGAWNSYALAFPQALPSDAAFLRGLTFVSYNHYDYHNMWHGLSAVVPFVARHIADGCAAPPRRWVLYHRGELRTEMGPWLSSLMEAAFGEPLNVETLEAAGGASPACLEKAVVMRHNEGGMSRERRLQVFDLLRCRARVFCNLSLEDRSSRVDEKGAPVIGMTLLMRRGPRSFKNETAVVGIFSSACRAVAGCRLTVAYAANNLTFCEQVKLMSETDVLVSAHGAQLSNMFMMDRNSSVMEFFPNGWLDLAGIGQFVYHWIASWSGMIHRGAWRDPAPGACPFPDHDRPCMSVYKNARIGHNETYFYQWATNVLSDARLRKAQQISRRIPASSACRCA